MNILILGGTREARQLAGRLVALGHDVTTSLAGRTQDPILPEGRLRLGPFGGVAGLTAYLRAANIDRLVDATHPYAGQMSSNAVAAAEESGTRLIRFMRTPWSQKPGQNWTLLETAQQAADTLPPGANVLLTTGHAGLETYLERDDCLFLVRVIEAPDFALPPHAQLIQTRPPHPFDAEVALMRRHGVTHLVSKNSGGTQTAAKLDAAAELGVNVIMIARPHYGPALEVDTIEAAVKALDIGVE
jgi:precorrin-6A/cobalt-precorrin-6A reductase